MSKIKVAFFWDTVYIVFYDSNLNRCLQQQIMST